MTSVLTSAERSELRLRDKLIEPSCDVEERIVDQYEPDRDQERAGGELDRRKEAFDAVEGRQHRRRSRRRSARNGTARPSEYEPSSSAAWPLCCCDAIARMPARIGPIHGDHPAANAMPTSERRPQRARGRRE